MKTSSHIFSKASLLLFSFMVLCPGQKLAFARETSSTTSVKSQLHVPWKLLQERLRAIANRAGDDGSGASNPIDARTISVPYEGEDIRWNLSGGNVSATVRVDSAKMGPGAATIAVTGAKAHVVLNSVSVDQVIERNVGGVVVRVHLNAVCGPIVIDQASASAAATFGLSWATGSPVASLATLDLSWAPGSWTFNDFKCEGPSGLDALVRDGLASYLRDPADLKPFIQQYIAANLQSSIDATLVRLREPFVLDPASKEPVTLVVGQLAPASTGVVADLTLRTSSKTVPGSALPVPSSSVLDSLSTSEPALIGGIDVLEFIVANRLAAQDRYYRINLQDVPAFHDLMHSRIKQLFAWKDLWHYPEDYPFYLNVFNPGSLKLRRAGSSSLSSSIPLKSNIQSYRDKTWWVYVETAGTAATTVDLSVSRGVLKYATSISSLKITSEYGAAYAKRYDKKKSKLPDDVVAKAIVGPQPGLSGSLKFPDIDLQQAGAYRAASFKWVSSSTFSLGFSAIRSRTSSDSSDSNGADETRPDCTSVSTEGSALPSWVSMSASACAAK